MAHGWARRIEVPPGMTVRRGEASRSNDSGSSPRIEPRLLNLRQAAAYLDVSYWTLRDYVLAGLLPTVTLPALRPRECDRPRQRLGRVLIDQRDLDAFIDRSPHVPYVPTDPGAPVVRTAAPFDGDENRPESTGIRTTVSAVCPR